jgi:hypothetical protein
MLASHHGVKDDQHGDACCQYDRLQDSIVLLRLSQVVVMEALHHLARQTVSHWVRWSVSLRQD